MITTVIIKLNRLEMNHVTIKKGDSINVEAMTQLFMKSLITRQVFRIPLEERQAKDMLTAAYKTEVLFRGRSFIEDSYTIKNISKIASILTSERPKQGIMMCGRCGNGKTTMLYAIRAMVRFLNDIGMFERNDMGIVVKDAKEINVISRNVNDFGKLIRTELLAIEDMGKEPLEVMVYGNVIAPVQDIIEYRYDKRLFTFITTNLSPQEITQRYGVRVGDRLKEMVSKIVFENDSYRQVIANQNRQKNGSSTG